MTALQTFESISLTFEAVDGYNLSGCLYRPERPDFAVLMSGGTGFPKEFYRHVAAYLATHGALVMLFDYRGIGGSAPRRLVGSTIKYTDWGKMDMPAALDALALESGDLPIYHLAHSVGGHFAGFMHNHSLIEKHAFVCVGSGYWRKHPLSFNLFELYFWWVHGPITLALKGYIPHGFGWKGTPLPKGVFSAWKRWCHHPSYFEKELETTLRPHFFEQITAPIKSWIYSDDLIANQDTAPDILRSYVKAPSEIELQVPKALGVKSIGHQGAFRRGNEALWDQWVAWFWES